MIETQVIIASDLHTLQSYSHAPSDSGLILHARVHKVAVRLCSVICTSIQLTHNSPTAVTCSHFDQRYLRSKVEIQ